MTSPIDESPLLAPLSAIYRGWTSFDPLHLVQKSQTDSNEGTMPTDKPPAYDSAIGQGDGRPNVNVTTPSGEVRSANEMPTGGNLERSKTNDTISSYESDTFSPAGVDKEAIHEMDDEQRDLPEGWVRCFDPKTEHHFYVEEATKRAIWM